MVQQMYLWTMEEVWEYFISWKKESLYNNGISRFCSASFQVAGRSNALCCPMTSGYEARSGNLIIVILNVCDKLINSVYVVRGDP